MKKPFKDTKVGKFLSKIGKSNIAKGIGEFASGDVFGALEVLLSNDKELTPEQREYALELLRMDQAEMEAVSRRWEADMSSDSWLSKNVRPLTLIFLTSFLAIVLVADSWSNGFVVESEWVDLLKSLLMTVFTAYFAGRSWEKTKRL